MKLKKYTTLKTVIRDRILIVTLNRPEVRNALNETMVSELTEVFSDTGDYSKVTNIIITGSGSSFCAGADLSYLKSLQGLTLADQKSDSENLLAMYKNIYYFSKPVTALVNGPAIGGGCGLAGICDFIIASDSAKFGYPEVKIGFTPAIVSVFLVYSLGFRKAKELLLSGRILDANEALDFGLITKIDSSENLFTNGIAFVQELAKNSPTSMSLTKKFINHIQQANSIDELLNESADFNARSRLEDDFIEGISAFIEKRSPIWKLK